MVLPPRSFFFGLGIIFILICLAIVARFLIGKTRVPVEIRSEYPKYRVEKDKNFPLLLKLLQDRRIFKQGVYVQNTLVPIKTVRIILTNQEQKNLAVKTKSENTPTAPLLTIVSSDFDVINDILMMKIYMSNDEQGLQSEEKDKLFTQELVELIYYVTAEFSKEPAPGPIKIWVFDDKAATEAVQTYFRDGLPIKIIHEQ